MEGGLKQRCEDCGTRANVSRDVDGFARCPRCTVDVFVGETLADKLETLRVAVEDFRETRRGFWGNPGMDS